jgi:hypothetical protein
LFRNILEEAFAHPLATQAAALLFGAFIIALATILLYYLVRPGREPRRTPKAGFIEEVSVVADHNDDRKDSVYQRVYVDHSRIRP